MEDNKPKYAKLSELVDSDFILERIYGYKYKKFDTESRRMISQDNWFEGSRKIYETLTNKGRLDLSESQLGLLFVKVQNNGTSTVNGLKVKVKSNGKTKIDVRYYLNPDKYTKQVEDVEDTRIKADPPLLTKDEELDKINLDDIPF